MDVWGRGGGHGSLLLSQNSDNDSSEVLVLDKRSTNTKIADPKKIIFQIRKRNEHGHRYRANTDHGGRIFFLKTQITNRAKYWF